MDCRIKLALVIAFGALTPMLAACTPDSPETEFGWGVNDFSSAEAFLNSGRVNQTSFLISDIRMPGMSGIELHDCLLKQGYAPPTIFITAFPTAVLHAQTQAQGALALLEKPIDANVVAHWLTKALGVP